MNANNNNMNNNNIKNTGPNGDNIGYEANNTNND